MLLGAGHSERDRTTILSVFASNASQEGTIRREREKMQIPRFHRKYTMGICISYESAENYTPLFNGISEKIEHR